MSNLSVPTINTSLTPTEAKFIQALDATQSSTSQKVKKVGLLILATLAATAGFVAQGIYSVGGIRKKK